MSLVADYGSSSSSDDESDSSSENSASATGSKHTLPTPVLDKLPTPNFQGSSTDTEPTNTSVFMNPFRAAENAKQAILEKHVKMVDTQDNVKIINGKKICWNYRKGRCRFGHNCIYAHDSDIQKTKEQLDLENEVQQTVICQNQDLPQPTVAEINQIKEETLSNTKNKKRPGLSQGITPGKKVIKMYKKQKMNSLNNKK